MALHVQSMPLLLTGLGLAAACILIAAARRARITRAGAIFGIAGLLLLAGACGGMMAQLPSQGATLVYVDLSASTRTAAYRQRGALRQRVEQLLAGAPHRIIYFAADEHETATGEVLGDLPGDTTRFAPPPDVAAVILFSDGRFDPPTVAPPVFAVIDPALAEAKDGRITDLAWSGGQAVATIVTDQPRELAWSGTADDAPAGMSAGSHIVSRAPASASSSIAVHLVPGDPWPENDALLIAPPPTETAARWWIGDRTPPAGWTALAPAAVPLEAAEWLSASVVILDNIAADDLNARQWQQASQYVRELGGTLIILGGERAFAAGAYPGMAAEDLSPLASHPPAPSRHWILLTDASGSMAARQGPRTRWQAVTDALARAVSRLPQADLVSVGSFAADVRWWVEARPAADALAAPLPPPDITPHGPTNLVPALEAITAARSDIPRQLLILTDGQAEPPSPRFAQAMRAAGIRLSLLAIGQGEAIDMLTQLARETGGEVLAESDAAFWSRRLDELIRLSAPDHLVRTPATIRTTGELPVPSDPVEPWNRTWLKPRAESLATTDGDVPMLARWRRGEGLVLAAAWRASANLVEAWAGPAASLPADPRFTITCTTGREIVLAVDAIEDGAYLNGLDLTAIIESPTRRESHALEQTAPGRYELRLPAPSEPAVSIVSHAGRILRRFALPGRYPAEFDAIGIDHAALRDLADRTGGQVIAPDHTAPLDLPRPTRPIDLTPWLAAAGFASLAAALFLARR